MAYRARQVGIDLRFVELAGEVNRFMPQWVVTRLIEEATRRGVRLTNGRILVIGVAYKPNTADTRESPAFPIMRALRSLSLSVAYHDPHVPRLPSLRHYPEFADMRSLPLAPETVASSSACIIVADHDDVDYALVHKYATLVVDTRAALRRRGFTGPHIVLA